MYSPLSAEEQTVCSAAWSSSPGSSRLPPRACCTVRCCAFAVCLALLLLLAAAVGALLLLLLLSQSCSLPLAAAALANAGLSCPAVRPAPAYGAVGVSLPVASACMNGAYAAGEWQRLSTAWYPYFPRVMAVWECDGGGSSAVLADVWHLNSSERQTLTAPLGSRVNSSQQLVRPALKYEWRPDSCALHPFPFQQPAQLCLALHGRSLLFVGDSITEQQYWALIFSLGAASPAAESDICQQLLDARQMDRLHRQCQDADAGQRLPALDYAACQGGRWNASLPAELRSTVRIVFIRNDHLTINLTESRMSTPNGRTDAEYPWQQAVNASTIVVLNAGLHMVERRLFSQRLSAAVSWLQSAYPTVPIVWRSSVPGHAFCQHPLSRAPLTRQQFEQLNHRDELLIAGNPHYYWEMVQDRNDAALEVLSNSSGWTGGGGAGQQQPAAPLLSSAALSACLESGSADCVLPAGGVYVLDVYPFDRLRPDAHRPGDCLHQCLPGPVDTWNKILFNLITRQAS